MVAERLFLFSLILVIVLISAHSSTGVSSTAQRRYEGYSTSYHPRRGKKTTPSVPSNSRSDPSSIESKDEMPSAPQHSKHIISETSKPLKTHHTKFVAECAMPTELGDFRMRSYVYKSQIQKLEPVAMIYGDVVGREDVIVRVHDQCFTSEVFGSLRCDCREQLQESLRLVRREGGVIIYLQQEGRGIGLSNKVAAYSLQDSGLDTVDANLQLGFKDEMREYLAVPDILDDLDIKSIRLITNNPFKISQLSDLGVKISERIQMQIPSNRHNVKYLLSKRDRMKHYLGHDLEQILTVKTNKLSARVFDHQLEHVFNEGGGATGKAKVVQSNHQEAAQEQPLASQDVRKHLFQSTHQEGNQEQDQDSEEDMESFEDFEDDEGIINAVRDLVGGSKPNEDEGEGNVGNVENEEVVGEDSRRGRYAFGKQSVEAAIEAIREGKVVLVVDDEDRENEGDLIMAGEKATPETVGYIVRYSSGVICASLESDRLDELKLPPMVVNNEDPKQTAYTVTVDYKHGTSTGISAADRAACFRALASPFKTADDFQRPGHVFPLRYKAGGVLARAGHTEASLDLCRLAGLYPCGVLAEVVNDDGSMKRLLELRVMAQEHDLVLTSVQDLIAYRMEKEGKK